MMIFTAILFCQTIDSDKEAITLPFFDFKNVGDTLGICYQVYKPTRPYSLVVTDNQDCFIIHGVRIGLYEQFDINESPIDCSALVEGNTVIKFRDTANVGQLINIKIERIK
jgi:hypothetical protein